LSFHSGREADHLPPSSAEVKEWVEKYIHSPNTPSWRGAPLGGAQGQLYLYLTGFENMFLLPLIFLKVPNFVISAMKIACKLF
jgi:hypothetical protein